MAGAETVYFIIGMLFGEGAPPLEPPEQPIRRTPIIGIATSRTWKLRFFASGFQ